MNHPQSDSISVLHPSVELTMLNGHKVNKATWAVPKTETHFALPDNASGSTVTYSIITDYGSISQTWSASVH